MDKLAAAAAIYILSDMFVSGHEMNGPVFPPVAMANHCICASPPRANPESDLFKPALNTCVLKP